MKSSAAVDRQPRSGSGAQPLSDPNAWLESLLVCCTILLLVYIRWQFVGIPMERDEGSYALLGQRLVTGARPYIDVYEHRPPGFFLAYGLLVKLAGYDYVHLQRAFCVVYALILVFSHLFFRCIMPKAVALALLPVYGLMLLNPHLSGFTTQSEFIVLLFVSLGMCALAVGMDARRTWPLLCAGAFLGWSALVKEVGLFYCACAALWLLIELREGRSVREVVRTLAAFGAGIAIAFAAAFCWVYQQGVLREATFWVVEFPRKYYLTAIPFTSGLTFLLYFAKKVILEQPLFWVLGCAGLICGAFWRAPLGTKLRYSALVLCAFCTVVPGFRFMNHYWVLFMPGLAVAISITYQWLAQRLGTSMGALLWGVFLLIPASNLLASSRYYFAPNFDDVLHAAYSSNPFPEMKVIGDYLNTRLQPGDEIFVAGSEPELYLYTKTMGVSRHSFIEFLTVPSPFAKQWQLEAIADVEKAKPRFIVNVIHPMSWVLTPSSDTTLYDWTDTYLPQHYNFIYVADQVEPGKRTVYTSHQERPDYKMQGAYLVAVWERKES